MSIDDKSLSVLLDADVDPATDRRSRCDEEVDADIVGFSSSGRQGGGPDTIDENGFVWAATT